MSAGRAVLLISSFSCIVHLCIGSLRIEVSGAEVAAQVRMHVERPVVAENPRSMSICINVWLRS